MTNQRMTVIQVSDRDEVEGLLTMMSTILDFDTAHFVLDVRVGIDPLDNGVKFSVNGMTWSPPIKGVINP